MTRLLILAAIIFSIASSVSAQTVDAINTPIGPITQGVTVPITWTLVAGVDATGKNGALSAQDTTTKNTITIAAAVPLAPLSYSWLVNVPPGTYALGLNDGAGLKQSGPVQIVAPAGGAAPPAGAPPATPAPGAPAPPTTGAPPAGAPPAGSSPAPSPPAPAPSAKTTPPGAPAPVPSANSGSTPSTPSISITSGVATPTPVSSASSIFSGYDVVIGLLGAAVVAMAQF